MLISVNGEQQEFADGTKVSDLLAEKSIKPEVVTVEVNSAIIHRERHAETELQDGDVIELVFFMGGGAPGGARSSLPRLALCAIRIVRT